MSIPAARRCRPTISRPCCATVSTRRPRPPGRWPAWLRRSGRTSPLTCSPRRVTSTSAPWWGRSTSCGAAGLCASSVTVMTFPTICSAIRHTHKSARRSAGCCTGAWRRLWSCCTRMTRTRSRRSSRSSMPAAGGRGGPWSITGGQPTSQRACLPMPRRSGCTRRHCRSCAACRRGRTGTGRNSKSSRPWPHRSTPGTATPHPSCSAPSNGRSTSRNHWAAETRRSPAWSRSGGRSSFKGASLTDTRRPPVR